MRPHLGAVTGEVSQDFYTYSAQFSNLLAGTSQTGSIQIEADSDFEVIKLSASAFQVVNTPLIASNVNTPIVTVLLTDTGSGRQLMNIPIPIKSLFGTAELPFILPQSKFLYARSVLAITVANFASGVDYSYLSLSFHGRKIFNRS